jgi:hypothetical protein
MTVSGATKTSVIYARFSEPSGPTRSSATATWSSASLRG